MKPKEIFGLIVRLAGLYFVYNAVANVPLVISALTSGRFGQGLYTILMVLAWPLAVAFWLLKGAPPISRIAYPDSNT